MNFVRAWCWSTFRSLGVVLTLYFMAGSGPSLAGAVSTPSLTGIFSQASFGAEPITVNWLAPGATIISPALASIDNAAEVTALYAAAPDAFPTINVYFVNSINFCDAPGTFSGCAEIRGHHLMVTSGFAASPAGNVYIAHEVAHNLGLLHTEVAGNLMNSFPTPGATAITVAQANIILNNQSGLLDVAPNGSVVLNLRPIAVLSAVPEPDAGLMAACGLLVVAVVARRRRTKR